MFNIIIQNSDTNIFQCILDLGSALIGYATGAITIYIAYLKFLSKKIKTINYTPCYKSFYGDELSIIIENQTLSLFSILEIGIVFDNNYLMQFIKYDTPLLLEPFKSEKIISSPITLSFPNLQELNKYENKFLRIVTSKGIIYSKIHGKIKNKNLRKYSIVSKHSDSINGIVVSNSIKYILYYKGENDELKTIFIDWAGFMDKTLTDFNALPKEIMNNKEQVEQVFENIFKPLDIPFTLEERDRIDEI